ncbi:hypothetical protein GSI_09380 [Ganoderma sinense ZZ0214-1]|uniref:BTB domain-containing protein n=1 Tax=Ganoderma sinense ZZ0214-1 TaxID=1077348 RepID=A0A2G8S6B7_9APHY|nr:hypothetical protein GSI_09380 [Ganoderma sinense ZZ0214-1]
MFSLPTLACGAARPDKPVVDVQEPAAVWTHVLSFCYFAPRPSSLTIDDVHALLEAARKYQMPGVTDWMRRTLVDEFVDKQPLSAFGLACAYKLDDVVRRAARASLLLPPNFSYAKELDLIPTRLYHRLLEYRRRCLQTAQKVLSWEFYPEGPSWLSDKSNALRYNRVFYALHPSNEPGQSGPFIGGGYMINHAWRMGMEALCKDIDKQLRPSSTFWEDADTIATRAQDFALLLDAEIERVVNEVELELDNDK